MKSFQSSIFPLTYNSCGTCAGQKFCWAFSQATIISNSSYANVAAESLLKTYILQMLYTQRNIYHRCSAFWLTALEATFQFSAIVCLSSGYMYVSWGLRLANDVQKLLNCQLVEHFSDLN